jgi:hypothetical protein
MNTRYAEQQRSMKFRFTTIVLGVLGLCISLAHWSQADTAPPPPLPPVPTATFTPVPTATSGLIAPFSGAFIRLHLQFSQTWSWDEMPWQALYTIVQWQDNEGTWHNVVGWQGTLDAVEPTADGHIMGYKTWWLAEDNFGTGPFRWQVYYRQQLLTTSELFYLPARTRRNLPIQVTLSPQVSAPPLPYSGQRGKL